MTAPAMDPAGVPDTSLTPRTHPPQMFDELYSLGPARPPAMPAFNASIFSSQIRVGPPGLGRYGRVLSRYCVPLRTPLWACVLGDK